MHLPGEDSAEGPPRQLVSPKKKSRSRASSLCSTDSRNAFAAAVWARSRRISLARMTEIFLRLPFALPALCFGFAVINSVSGNVKLYSYEDLRIATEDFSPMNKVGNRGFEPVYKGTLVNGIKVAIKVLSSESTQGAKEFLSEIAAISDIVHENLVKLYGACIEGDYRILVYNYLENNSLAQTLLVPQ
ncbi:putative leucine-rich repeat receptor-like serine/threonine-protein kinase [Platanthera zijinensis]|uniref:Leucine-rich repeat receptor-like serine/threonine-protein kinase n=1 Tax=Platanthera zijinensis TaxID=2320716 RepID=A0AAP0BS30_9ASPA